MTFRKAKKNTTGKSESFMAKLRAEQKEYGITVHNLLKELEEIRDSVDKNSDIYKAYEKFILESRCASNSVDVYNHEAKQFIKCMELAIHCHKNPDKAGNKAAELKTWFAASASAGKLKALKGALWLVAAVSLGAAGAGLIIAGSWFTGVGGIVCFAAAGITALHGARLFGDYRRMRKLYKAGEDLAETCHTGRFPAKS